MKVNIGLIKQLIVRRIVEVCHVEKDISHSKEGP